MKNRLEQSIAIAGAALVLGSLVIAQEYEARGNLDAFSESFELVWTTIDDRFYDGAFNGVDWHASHDRFVAATEKEDVEQFYHQINTMLFELGVSHLGVVPMDDVEQLGEPTVFGEGTVGIDVRLVERSLRIVRVDPESAAARAGLSPGFEIISVNGATVESLRAERALFPVPPFTDRNLDYMTLNELGWELMGTVGEEVQIEYKDGSGTRTCVTLEREPRGAAVVFDEGLPSTYVQFDSRIIDEDIGYMRFNTFHPEVIDDFESSMREFAELSSVIIDLRGNPGGAFAVRHRFASKFVNKRTLIWLYRGRGGVDEIFLDIPNEPYLGDLVILVDGLSASSSEEFAGGLQAIGRATIVGERSPGRDLVADILALPIGAYFVFPIAETATVDGVVLENRGVIPNIEVLHNSDALAEGRDLQIEAALRFLQQGGSREPAN